MVDIVQEKFQVNAPQNPNDDGRGGWATDASARTRRNLQTRDRNQRFEPYHGDMLASLPPGTDIEGQEVSCAGDPIRPAGALMSGSQVTEDVTPQTLRAGFDKKRLLQTDDMYTREHNDAFYDDVGGFVERNNMLDRM